MRENFGIVRKVSGNLKKGVLAVTGTIFVGLGVLGVFLPLLPATPFFLLAAACYVRSSQTFYDWLLNNRVIGGYIKDYREKRGIRLRAKIIAIALLWISILYTAIFAVNSITARAILVMIAIGTTTYLLSIRTIK
jgi:uncharacterized protein